MDKINTRASSTYSNNNCSVKQKCEFSNCRSRSLASGPPTHLVYPFPYFLFYHSFSFMLFPWKLGNAGTSDCRGFLEIKLLLLHTSAVGCALFFSREYGVCQSSSQVSSGSTSLSGIFHHREWNLKQLAVWCTGCVYQWLLNWCASG